MKLDLLDVTLLFLYVNFKELECTHVNFNGFNIDAD